MATSSGNNFSSFHSQLRKCWDTEFGWHLLPKNITEGCAAVGSLLDVPPLALLSGILGLLSFAIAHAQVEVPNTLWREPAILWLAIVMPTGTGKSTIYRYLTDILRKVRTKLENEDMVLKNWLLSDQNVEKLGELMAKNDGKVLGLCDELTNLLSQVNLHSGAKGLLDTHEFTKVLELFSGTAWSRQTVSGNANFNMPRTCLTLCGMTKPTTAFSLIVDKNNFSKGLASRFLWIFPRPVFNNFSSLQIHANEECSTTATEFTSIVALYSKAKGQYLRLALPLHALFLQRPLPDALPRQIPEPVLEASIAFAKLCIQHTALVAGTSVNGEREAVGENVDITQLDNNDNNKLQQVVLSSPGHVVSGSKMILVNKFRQRGGKQTVLNVFNSLVQKKLGTLLQGRKGTVFFLKKNTEVLGADDLLAFIRELHNLGITLAAYQGAFKNDTHATAIEAATAFSKLTEHQNPNKKRKTTYTSIPSTSDDA
ncbi:uncharacterized protein LOC114970457 isoform X2 [Acropora millepora]|uniref:uncharacterized protein LOC114970457 isoform X2 n=1 Tax=Acropora millepora TaxID=45264 RepID=UPI001CF439F2|nr:uncharacterized protein LOC114970457 isoform X2 [Acropora millepora]